MIEIRNLMFQPFTLHLAGDAGSIHLGSRERRVISEDQLSDEMRVAEARGFVLISEVAESTQPDPRVEMADDEHSSAGTGSSPSEQPKPRKRRQA